MLSLVLKPGDTAPNISGNIQRPAAGKTGTTENFKDTWFVGYTPDLEKDKSTLSTGAQLAAPVWASFIKEALKEIQPREFPIPVGVVRVKICPDDGLLAGDQNTQALEAVFERGLNQPSCAPGREQALL